MEHLYITRRDDYEGRGEDDKHAGMIVTTEVMRDGTRLSGGIDIDTHASDIERACLFHGLNLMAEKGLIGASNRQGFGKVHLEFGDVLDGMPYVKFIHDKKSEILNYLESIDALEKSYASGEFDSDGPF